MQTTIRQINKACEFLKMEIVELNSDNRKQRRFRWHDARDSHAGNPLGEVIVCDTLGPMTSTWRDEALEIRKAETVAELILDESIKFEGFLKEGTVLSLVSETTFTTGNPLDAIPIARLAARISNGIGPVYLLECMKETGTITPFSE